MDKRYIKRAFAIFLFLFLFCVSISVVSAGTISDCATLDSANTIYTLTANVSQTSISCFNITATNVTLDCDGYWITGDNGIGYGVNISAANATVKDCTFLDWEGVANIYIKNNMDYPTIYNNTMPFVGRRGIDLSGSSDYFNISNNIINMSWEGILIRSSTEGHVVENDISNAYYGIEMYSNANSNTVTGNTIEGNYTQYLSYGGIYLYESKNNNVSENNITKYTIPILVDLNTQNSTYCSNIILNNTGDNGNFIYYANTSLSGDIDDGTFSQIILCNADNSLIDNVTIEGDSNMPQGSGGIFAYWQNNINISNSNISYSSYGYYVGSNSSNVTLSNNIIMYGGGYGIYMRGNDHVIQYNQINHTNSTNIYMRFGDNVTVQHNSIYNASNEGIYLNNINNSVVDNNTVDLLVYFPIILWQEVYGNNITNNIVSNSYVGVYGGGIYVTCNNGGNNNLVGGNVITNTSSRGISIFDCPSGVVFDNNVDGSNVSAYYIEVSEGLNISNNVATNSTIGIHLYQSNTSLLFENTVDWNTDYGIFIDSSSFNDVQYNVFNYNTNAFLVSNASSNSLFNNTADDTGSLVLDYGDNNTIFKNVVNNGVCGLEFRGNSTANNISYNYFQENTEMDICFNINLTRGMPDCDSFVSDNIGSGGREIYFTNETLTTEIDDGTYSEVIFCGVEGSTSDNITVSGSDSLDNNAILFVNAYNVTISNSNSTDNRYGAFFYNSTNNSITDSIFALNGQAGVGLNMSNWTTISGNLFDTQDGDGIRIYGSSVYNNISNSNFTSNIGWSLYDGSCQEQYWWQCFDTENNTLEYSNEFGFIGWSNYNISFDGDLEIGTNLYIEDNNIGLDSSEDLYYLNSTANITFRGLSYSSQPWIMKNDVRCDTNPGLCGVVNWDQGGGILDAYVTNFSNYTTLGEGGDCGYINNDITLTGNISGDDTCLIVNASNLEIDCDGYKITYGTNGGGSEYGISNNGWDNVTIRNCNIALGDDHSSSLAYGIYFYNGAFNATLIDNNITSDYDYGGGIYLTASQESIVYNNNVTLNNENSGRGISLYNSNLTNVSSNFVFLHTPIGGGDFIAGITIEYANNTDIIDNEIITIQANAIGMRYNSHDNNISFNTIDTNPTGPMYAEFGDGIYATQDVNNTYVAGNTFDIGGDDWNFTDSSAVKFDEDCYDVTIIDNEIITNGTGIDMDEGGNVNITGVVIQDNTINVYNNISSGSGISLNYLEDPIIYNNTIIGNGSGGIYIFNGKGDYNITENYIEVNTTSFSYGGLSLITMDVANVYNNTIISNRTGISVDTSIVNLNYNNITTTGSTSAINTAASGLASYSNITYNNITSFGGAMSLSSSPNVGINIIGNTIWDNSTTSSVFLDANLENATFFKNNLTYEGVGGYALRVSEWIIGINITDNDINSYGASSTSLNIGCTNLSTVYGNRITTAGASSTGIILSSCMGNVAYGSNVTYNNITITNSGYGIHVDGGNFTKIAYNHINSTGDSGYGMYISGDAITSDLELNDISTSGLLGHGVYILGSNISMNNNTIYTSGANANGIYTGESTNVSFINNDISVADTSSFSIFHPYSFGDNSYKELIYDNGFGRIYWNSTNITTRLNLTVGVDIYIEDNNVGVVDNANKLWLNNSTGDNPISIELRGVDFSNPWLMKNGERCDHDESLCNVTYDDINDIMYANISSFSNYTVEESSVGVFCGDTLTSHSTLTQNVSASGTCFTIGANDVTLDCDGYYITYATTNNQTYGIYNSYGNYNRTTIKNCNFIDGNNLTYQTHTMMFIGGEDNMIYNNTLLVNSYESYGIYFFGTESSNISYNNITTNSTSGWTGEIADMNGIYLDLNSDYNNVTSNIINTYEGNGKSDGIEIIQSSNNLLRDNIVTADSAYGAQARNVLSSALDIHSSSLNTVVLNNTFATRNLGQEARVVSIGPHSHNNYFENNTITRVSFHAWDSRGNLTYSNSNGNIFVNNRYGDSHPVGVTSSPEFMVTGGESNALVYNNSYGEIKWEGTNITTYLNLSVNDAFDVEGISFGPSMYIQDNLIGLVDNNESMTLNGSASIKFYGLAYPETPWLMKNGARCDNTPSLCNISYDDGEGILYANVSSFSNYTTTSVTGEVTACGNVNRDVILTQNISSNGNCFNITANDITLDCQNNYIFFGITQNNSVAIYDKGFDGITIKNCNIYQGPFIPEGAEVEYVPTDEAMGIYMESDGEGLTLLDSITIYNNTFDMYTGDESNALFLLIDGANITGNTIDMRGSSGLNEMTLGLFALLNNSVVEDNYIDVKDSEGAISVYLTGSFNNNLINNIFSADSDGLYSIGLVLADYGGMTDFTNNTKVVGGVISTIGSATNLYDVWVNSTVGFENYLINVSINKSKINVIDSGLLYYQQYMDVEIVNEAAVALNNAQVNSTNVLSILEDTNNTNVNGLTRLIMTEFVANEINRYYATPHNISAIKSGFEGNSTLINLSISPLYFTQLTLQSTGAPVVTFTANPTTVTNGGSITFSCLATHAGGVSSTVVSVGGTNICSGTSSCSGSSVLGVGTHTASCTAVAGGETTIETLSVTVNKKTSCTNCGVDDPDPDPDDPILAPKIKSVNSGKGKTTFVLENGTAEFTYRDNKPVLDLNLNLGELMGNYHRPPNFFIQWYLYVLLIAIVLVVLATGSFAINKAAEHYKDVEKAYQRVLKSFSVRKTKVQKIKHKVSGFKVELGFVKVGLANLAKPKVEKKRFKIPNYKVSEYRRELVARINQLEEQKARISVRELVVRYRALESLHGSMRQDLMGISNKKIDEKLGKIKKYITAKRKR